MNSEEVGGVSLRVRVALYGAILATAGAFGTFFSEGGFWYFMGAAVVAIVIGSLARFRFLLLLPALAAYLLLAIYREVPLSREGWRELGARIGEDVYTASGTMYTQPIPYEPAAGLFVVLLPMVFVLAVFAASATLHEESPVISVAVLGLTIGVVSTLNFETGTGIYFAAFLVCGVALLLGTGTPQTGARGATAAALVVVGVLLVPQISQAAIRPPLVDWTQWGAGGERAGAMLEPQADVGNYLTGGEDIELFRVRSEEPLNWRGGTLDYFDGVNWEDSAQGTGAGASQIEPGVPTRQVGQQVRVLNASTEHLFGGYEISATSLDGARQNYDGSWTANGPIESGTSYQVLSEIPQPTEEQLRLSPASYPAGVQSQYLQLPEELPEEVGATAAEIEGSYDTATPYDRARAIESYLKTDGDFTYNIEVDFDRADEAMEDFLGEEREGFCTQFATAMTLIARDMDLPSRMVYGATTGEPVAEDEYLVRGENMHTWVEIYFPGVGWYPFDPTPGFAMPEAMEENAPRPIPNGEQLTPDELMPQSPVTDPGEQDPDQNPATDPDDPAGSGAGGPTLPAGLVYALAAGLLIGAIPATKYYLAARATPRALYLDLMGRARDLPGTDFRTAASPALTASERVLLVPGAAGLASRPFREFARAYSEHLYAREPSGSGTDHAYRQAVREYRRLPLWRRTLAAANPASLLWRARRRIREEVSRRGPGASRALREHATRLLSEVRRRVGWR